MSFSRVIDRWPHLVTIVIMLAALGWLNRPQIDAYNVEISSGWPWEAVSLPSDWHPIHDSAYRLSWLGLLLDFITAVGFLAVSWTFIWRT